MGHENLTREQVHEGSSDRSFGLVLASALLVIALWPLWRHQGPRWWWAGVAAALGLVGLVKPALLAGLNRQWTALGLLLGKLTSPIVLGLLFYGFITPLAFAMRLAGKDPLRLKFDRAADSYWIRRDPPGPEPESMTNQF
jgi:hypothetical protein